MKPYSLEQIRILEEKMITYEIWVFTLVLFVAVLILVVVMQRLTLAKFKSSELYKYKQNLKLIEKSSQKKEFEEPSIVDIHTITQTHIHTELIVSGKDLPEPGTVFKFSIPNDGKRRIVIGKREGNIITHSSEISDHHLTIDISPLDQSNMEFLSYQLEFKREGKALFQLPNQKDFVEMEMKEIVFVTDPSNLSGPPSYSNLELSSPIRFRLGGKLSVDGKFKIGYFEFHLYTKDILERTNMGNKRHEKQFYLKLHKIIPGYDTARQSKDGVVPMLARFGGKL